LLIASTASTTGSAALVDDNCHSAVTKSTLSKKRQQHREQQQQQKQKQITKLTASDGAAGDSFGFFHQAAVSEDTNVIVVGAMGRDNFQGAVYVYTSTETPTNHNNNSTSSARRPPFTEMAILTARDGQEHDAFGNAIAMDNHGEWIVVGAMAQANSTGAVYLFRIIHHEDSNNSNRTTTTTTIPNITQWAKLTAPAGMVDDNFGVSVAMDNDGTRIIVGANLVDDDDGGNDRGSAFIFGDVSGTSGDAATWSLLAQLTPSDDDDGVPPSSYQEFGIAVAIADTTVVVGSGRNDRVYVFEEDVVGHYWTQAIILTPSSSSSSSSSSNNSTEPRFGHSIAIAQDWIAVGAFQDHTIHGDNAGAVYMFQKMGGTKWTEMIHLVPADGASFDFFGRSVAISKDATIMAVSAHLADDPNHGKDSGCIHLFQQVDSSNSTGSIWTQVGKLVAEDGQAQDFLGSSLAISNTTVVAGAYGVDENGLDSGSAYLFEMVVSSTVAPSLTPKTGEPTAITTPPIIQQNRTSTIAPSSFADSNGIPTVHPAAATDADSVSDRSQSIRPAHSSRCNKRTEGMIPTAAWLLFTSVWLWMVY
jgi:hypothetical protein